MSDWTAQQEASRRNCLANWPEAENGAYNPACCRWPKSCSVEEPPKPQVRAVDTDEGPDWDGLEYALIRRLGYVGAADAVMVLKARGIWPNQSWEGQA